MKNHAVMYFVYSSAAAIFGELLTPSINESHPQNADSPYSVNKPAAEQMILAYSGIYDIIGVRLRYYNKCGVNHRYDLNSYVIPIFARRNYSSKPINI